MKPSIKPKADATNPALPSYQQMVALALEVAERALQDLIRISANDEHWREEDVYVDMSVELALSHIQRMKSQKFDEKSDFSWELSKVSAPLKLGMEQFSRKECVYMRCLTAASHMLDKLDKLDELTFFVDGGVAA